MHKGDFWGLFGIRLGRCPCIIPEKMSFLQFYSRFNPNALVRSVFGGHHSIAGGGGWSVFEVNILRLNFHEINNCLVLMLGQYRRQ